MMQTTNAIELNVIEQGSGPLALVFLHYFGGSALEWQVVMDSLSEQHHCIAVDLRGYGDSTPVDGFPAETTFSVDDMASDVLTVIEQRVPGNYVVIGHSMSGKVALALAAGLSNGHQSAGLQSLILVSPSPPVPEPIADDERQKLIKGYGKQEAAEQTLKNITFVAVSEAVRKQIIADDLRTAKPAWMAWLQEGSLENISPRMTAIAVPIHIVVGAKDNALPPDVQDKMVLPYLKGATVEIIQGAGHLLPWETPNELAAFIAKKIAA